MQARLGTSPQAILAVLSSGFNEVLRRLIFTLPIISARRQGDGTI